uniref:Uncharacterized protein n=1 Tax=Inoviridae sp. ct4fI15 TaxID=2825776 RepID=A0A8S5UKP0_9VIRU|nr:MAG TPA: hypothetical protein [Inoviridae sp. ct4fI15]
MVGISNSLILRCEQLVYKVHGLLMTIFFRFYADFFILKMAL